MTKYICPVLAFIAAVAASPMVSAIDGDRDQPIQIEADSLEIRDNDNISVYSGNVSLVQGSMQIHSDRLTIHFNDEKELVLMEMDGNPATFRQLNNDNQEMLGRALRLDYHEADSLLVLSGKARFENNGDIIEGSTIRINTESDFVEANGAAADERVRVVIQPKSRAEKSQ